VIDNFNTIEIPLWNDIAKFLSLMGQEP